MDFVLYELISKGLARILKSPGDPARGNVRVDWNTELPLGYIGWLLNEAQETDDSAREKEDELRNYESDPESTEEVLAELRDELAALIEEAAKCRSRATQVAAELSEEDRVLVTYIGGPTLRSFVSFGVDRAV